MDIEYLLQKQEILERDRLEEQELKEKLKESEMEVEEIHAEDGVEEVKTEQLHLRTNPMLWAEKYKSNKYFELLSDEQTNRSVLTWFKSWNELVFPENAVNLKIPQSMIP